MSFETERASLETRFYNNWVETPVKWPNVRIDTSGLDEFVAVTLVYDDAKQAQIGSIQHMYRYYAFIVTQVFVTPNSGSRRAYELADLAADIWRAISFDFITIQNPTIKEVGVVDGWYQLDLINPYYRNEYKAESAA